MFTLIKAIHVQYSVGHAYDHLNRENKSSQLRQIMPETAVERYGFFVCSGIGRFGILRTQV